MAKNNTPKENEGLQEEEVVVEQPAFSVFHNLSGSLLSITVNGKDLLIQNNEKFSVLTSHEDQVPQLSGLIKVNE